MSVKAGKIFKKSWVSLIVLAVIIGITYLTVISGPKPRMKPITEKEIFVNTIKTTPIKVAPSILGYGEAIPAETWKAVAQVAAKVAWKSPKLKNGEFFKKGEIMLRLEENEIKLAISKCEAGILKCKAKITELESTRVNIETQLKVMKKIYNFNNSELTRQKKLFRSHAVAATAVETKEIALLNQHNSILSMESKLRLLPAQIDFQKAELKGAEIVLKQAKLDLDHAKISAPFACRISSISVEQYQYVRVGEEMFSADNTAEMEIPVQLSLEQMELLFNSKLSNHKKPEIKKDKEKSLPDWHIQVSANFGKNTFSWDARFLRIEAGIDTTTRMITMVVGVLNPYTPSQDNSRPPFSKGLFCSVKIIGKAQPGQIVVPRSAIHNGKLYLADKAQRLEIRPVKTSCNIGLYSIIAEGVKENETVLTSDVVPAVSGMKLIINTDKKFAATAARKLSGIEVK